MIEIGYRGSGRAYARHSHHRKKCYCPRRRRDSAPCRAIERLGERIVRRSTADASKRRTRNRPNDKPFPWPFSPNHRRLRCVRISRTWRRKFCTHAPSGTRVKCECRYHYKREVSIVTSGIYFTLRYNHTANIACALLSINKYARRREGAR